MRVRGLLLAVAAVSGLTACGTNEEADTQAPVESTQSDSPATSSSAIVGAEQAPEGYVHEDFYALFGSSEAPEPKVVNPPQCEPLAADVTALAEWGALPREESPVAMYTSESEAMALVHADNRFADFDGAGCTDFTRENATSLGTIVTSFSVRPTDVQIEGADQVQAFEQTVTGLTLDGEEMDTGKVGEESTILIVDSPAKPFMVVGLGGAELDDLVSLAEAQVATQA